MAENLNGLSNSIGVISEVVTWDTIPRSKLGLVNGADSEEREEE